LHFISHFIHGQVCSFAFYTPPRTTIIYGSVSVNTTSAPSATDGLTLLSSAGNLVIGRIGLG